MVLANFSMATGQLLTIQNLDLSGIQMVTVPGYDCDHLGRLPATGGQGVEQVHDSFVLKRRKRK